MNISNVQTDNLKSMCIAVYTGFYHKKMDRYLPLVQRHKIINGWNGGV
jgi:hypothetical protein